MIVDHLLWVPELEPSYGSREHRRHVCDQRTRLLLALAPASSPITGAAVGELAGVENASLILARLARAGWVKKAGLAKVADAQVVLWSISGTGRRLVLKHRSSLHPLIEPEVCSAREEEPDVLGAWEAAEYLGVERSRLSRWLKELDAGKKPIAAPLARHKSGPIWRCSDVRAKADSMYRDCGSPHGEDGLDRWLAERRERRRQPRDMEIAACISVARA
jgi:hypothetical protein